MTALEEVGETFTYTMYVEKERQTKRRQIRRCCYAVDQHAFVFGATHIIAHPPASYKELVIVPSTFDTNIYTHTQTYAQIPLHPSSHTHQEKLPSVRFVMASTKTSLREGRR